MTYDDRAHLEWVEVCIERITRWTAAGRHELFGDEKTYHAVLYNLQTLAESLQRISPPQKRRHPDVPWRAIAGFRNVVVHGYLALDKDVIWDVVSLHLPVLKPHVARILAEI